MPLINIIASGVYCPVAVLAISDCTSHMADGNIKDANYISNDLFLPHFKKIDPDKNSLILLPLMAPQMSKKPEEFFVLIILSVLQFMVVSMLSV